MFDKIVDETVFLETIFDELWPINRSITGPGLEKSFEILQKYIPLEIEKISSGSKVFDWMVPPEWHLTFARLTGPDGQVICNSDRSNLEVLNYSEPKHISLDLQKLLPHLHSLEHLPEAIPYVTSYYNRTWGFCMPDKVKQNLQEGMYKVEIDSEFVEGGVPFGQHVLEGESKKEILLTSYLCHPSLANNELSGPLVLSGLYRRIKKWPKHRFTYRFLLNPETIGSLCFLSKYHQHLQSHLMSGLILTCLGGPNAKLRYKASRRADSLFDQLTSKYKTTKSDKWLSQKFSPLGGSDERQYCAPGFNLPMGQVARTIYGEYDGYHNSLDTKEFMDINQIVKSIDEIEALLWEAEISGNPVNMCPFGEPQLGKRGLYPNLNSGNTWGTSSDEIIDSRLVLNRILTILNSADGETSMLKIASELDCELEELRPIIERLEEEKLLAFNTDFPKAA